MTEPQQWGIDLGYEDVAGRWHRAPQSTIDALFDVMGASAMAGPPPAGPAIMAGPGRPHPHLAAGELHLEDGAVVAVDGPIPGDLPIGYHRYIGGDGAARPLICSPGRCWLPDGLSTWGWAAQLYAARSTASWGMGDLSDLRRLGQWAAGQGAGMTLINPLHAPLTVEPQQTSPYFASSRCFRNPLYLRIEEVPGAGDLVDLDRLAAAGRALNAERLIDRDAIWRLKSAALEAIYSAFRGDAAFDHYLEEQGAALRGYATFCALGERHGFPWEKWPDDVRKPDGPGIARFAAGLEGADRIRYHSWVQWLLDQQLASASHAMPVVQDLAIGADAGGADAWRWQDTMALAVRVGAPPDEYNMDGQDWGLPPFDPWRLRSAGYQPFIELVRAGLRHAGGMRFDHVMGLFRLYWIPQGASPTEGTYVRYPFDDLLDILAIESHRAGAYVIGEDLGTVEDSTRTELSLRHVLSYRLLWFEPSPPGSGDWPYQALAAATTHDLPTVAGLWTGTDLAARLAQGLGANEGAELALRDRIADWTGLEVGAPPSQVVRRVYRLLGRSPCAIVTATLDDALAVEERPNMPGTTDQWPNWMLALPQSLEQLEQAPLAHEIGVALNDRGQPNPDGG